MINKMVTPFQQQFGKLCLCSKLFECGKKCVYIEEYGGFSSEQLTNILNGDLCCGCRFYWRSPHKSLQKRSAELGVLHLTMFDHKRDLVMKSFWPVFVIELGDADMRLSQRMCLVVGMISGNLVSWESSLFRWICSLLQLPILKCFLGLNRILVTCLIYETTHHTWW